MARECNVGHCKEYCICPECGGLLGGLRALHWHLRYEHEFGAEEAYEAAGGAARVSLGPDQAAGWRS